MQKTTPLMHSLIVLWLNTGMLLFWANKGESLICEICSGAETTCANETQNCLPVLNKCATLQSESIVTEQETQLESLEVPPINRTLNGKECKGCFGLHKTSCQQEEVVHCTGEQMYCVELYGTASIRNPGTIEAAGQRIPKTEIALKGCASETFCDAFHKGWVHVSTLVVIAEGDCWLAADRGGTTPLRIGGAFLLGLLLMKILI
ncbi:phospholipase A2 inhibitor gamma subunit B isoform X3 [Anolis carolinensis]|uniref:phospholipase A2 inhibitor gamma subunit B isoform X3 n=1 Tax=Anolis carolinensis TaxID=28377 RepID=UPI002F2B23A3